MNRQDHTTSNTVDKMLLRIVKIVSFADGQPLANATGFFCLHDVCLYLITSRHVVVNEVGQPRPDLLRVSLHSDANDLRQSVHVSIPLYAGGMPQWHEHPRHRAGVDVVAVSINDPHVLSKHFVATFCCNDIVGMYTHMPLGQKVLILGFPLGFHDTLHNLPIVRSATIASAFSCPFKGEPYFLTDARLHRGMSGSPVIVNMQDESEGTQTRGRRWGLLGVHSSTLDVSDRDPVQDERLALNTAWYASLIPEMIPSRQ